MRYWLKKQDWDPFSLEPVEFAALNFDFHPESIRRWLSALDFSIAKTLSVSHFRVSLLKRNLPPGLLATLDGWLHPTGAFLQVSPSIFVKSSVRRDDIPPHDTPSNLREWFQCPECATHPLRDMDTHLDCPQCGRKWAFHDGIYDFREAMKE